MSRDSPRVTRYEIDSPAWIVVVTRVYPALTVVASTRFADQSTVPVAEAAEQFDGHAQSLNDSVAAWAGEPTASSAAVRAVDAGADQNQIRKLTIVASLA